MSKTKQVEKRLEMPKETRQQEEATQILGMADEGREVPPHVPGAEEGEPSPDAPADGAENNHGDLFAESIERLTTLGQGEYQELRLCGKRMVEHYWRFGQILVAIKRKVGHGAFSGFCEAHSWDLNWVRRSMRIFKKNPNLEDCKDMGVVEACHYNRVLEAEEAENAELESDDEEVDKPEEEEGEETDTSPPSSASSTSDPTPKDPGTVYDPPRWLLLHDGNIIPIDGEAKGRYRQGKKSFGKSEGVLFNTKAQAVAAYTKLQAERPKFPNCKRVLLEEERANHPAWTNTYILNDGRVVLISGVNPSRSANRIWYTWDGSTIQKVDRAAIATELYGISTEKLSEPSASDEAKLLEGHKTYEVSVILRGAIRLCSVDEDEAKVVLDADWEALSNNIELKECEAVDVHEAPAEAQPQEADLDDDDTADDQEEEEEDSFDYEDDEDPVADETDATGSR